MKSPRIIATIPLVAFVLFASNSRAAHFWPQFRGPNGSGVAESATPPLELGSAKNLRWKTSAPAGVSSPIVWGEHLFLTGVIDKDLVTLAYDVRTGREQWRRVVTPEKLESVHTFSSAATATPCTDGRHVFAYFNSFGVVAYDFEGKEVWRRPLPMLPVAFGSGSSPFLTGDRLIVQRDCRIAASHVLALDASTGATIWDAARPFASSSYSTPMIWRHDGVEELMVFGTGRVTAYDLANGEVKWWVRGWGLAAICTPVVGHGLLFVGAKGTGDPAESPPQELNWDHLIAAYDADKDGSLAHTEVPADLAAQIRPDVPRESTGNSLNVRWVLNHADASKDGVTTKSEWDATVAAKGRNDLLMAVRPGGRDDATETHVAWETMKGLSEMPSPLYYRERLYIIADGGRLTVLNPVTGERILDRQPIGVNGQYVASPVAANGGVYVANERGELTVLRAGDALEIAAKAALGEHIRSTPAIAGRSIFVRTSGHMWAFGE